jgi:phytoene/squalene synthetase
MNAGSSYSSAELARSFTRSGSIQTYFTARLMVDKDLVDDFFRAYAYFRWIDDVIDVTSRTDHERAMFISRQKELIDGFYQQQWIDAVSPEEEMLRDLIKNDRGDDSGLQSFIRNMFAIIEFDAHRKGRLISQDELDWYVNTLGTSVVDGLLYFIGNGRTYPNSENKYQAGIAAHISHLLRDMRQDDEDGFINIPREYLVENEINHTDIESSAYLTWVQARVELARDYFTDGKQYLNKLDNLRAKVVGHWYCARFEVVLDTIDNDGFVLRNEYHERRRISTWLKILWLGISLSFQHLLSNSLISSTGQNENN